MSQHMPVTPDSPAALVNRELSWLSFARRVLALAQDPEQPPAWTCGSACDQVPNAFPASNALLLW
jgi:hypothetical protein